MSELIVPLAKPKPDADRMIDILMGRRPCDRAPMVEYLVDDVHIKTVITELLGRQWVEPVDQELTGVSIGGLQISRPQYLDNFIQFWHRMGYDAVRTERNAGFKGSSQAAVDPAVQTAQRYWQELHTGPIGSWEDFEKYPWPQAADRCFADLVYINDHLPDGMGLIASHCSGLYEHLSMLMGYETLCMALHDDPKLVQAIADRVGRIMEQFYLKLVQLDRLVAVWPGDDMGFRIATLIRPEQLRKYTLPWHKRFAQIAHDNGLPYFLHSCGNLGEIYEDLIEDVKINGKHSFEDAILPAEQFHEKYSDRIATLGGVDINILAGGQPQQVRKRTRELIDTCGPRGRYAIGSGNSIPTYIPLENYMTMLDEALR